MKVSLNAPSLFLSGEDSQGFEVVSEWKPVDKRLKLIETPPHAFSFAMSVKLKPAKNARGCWESNLL